MAISKNNTKTMSCNTRLKWDFIPELKLGNEEIEVVQKIIFLDFS